MCFEEHIRAGTSLEATASGLRFIEGLESLMIGAAGDTWIEDEEKSDLYYELQMSKKYLKS